MVQSEGCYSRLPKTIERRVESDDLRESLNSETVKMSACLPTSLTQSCAHEQN